MDCQTWQNLLDDLLADKLAPAERRAAEEHLAGCPRCRALLAAAADARRILSGSQAEDLTGAVLARTSGPACGRAATLLPEFVDGSLDPLDGQLVRVHLEHCRDCRALADILTWLVPVLPELAHLVPDADFVGDVLRVTSLAPPPRPTWPDRLRERWRRWVARPRFALEFAYAATLVLLALCATPISPLRETPGRALEAVQANPLGVVAPLGPPLAEAAGALGGFATRMWQGSGGRVGEQLQHLEADLAARGRRAAPAVADLKAHGGKLKSSLLRADFAAAAWHAARMWDDIKRTWHAFRRGTPAAGAPPPAT